MADKRTRSDHFLWQQQRLREDSNRKHAERIRNDREFDYNRRGGAGRSSSGGGGDIGPFLPLIWFLIKWFFALMLWNVLVGFVNGPTTVLGIIITVIFVSLTILKQVRRFKKRYL
jgi:hypothetical protein